MSIVSWLFGRSETKKLNIVRRDISNNPPAGFVVSPYTKEEVDAMFARMDKLKAGLSDSQKASLANLGGPTSIMDTLFAALNGDAAKLTEALNM